MSDNLVLELLRAIRTDLADLRGHMERAIAELRVEHGGRFNRVLDWPDRIERRLDLQDA